MLALALFLVGLVEYVLAAAWTRVVVSKQAVPTALVTFVNVMLWGFVITNLEPGNPSLLVVHGLGCAIGAAATCIFGGSSEAADDEEATPTRQVLARHARRRRSRGRRPRPIEAEEQATAA